VVQAPTANFRRIKLGDLVIYSLSDGFIERPLQPGIVKNAGLDEIRAALREAGQSDSVVVSPFTAMALERDGSIALIDSGTGGKSCLSRPRPSVCEDDYPHSPPW
jgi:hypothetical protein